MKSNYMKATFKAYQGADRDKLMNRLIDCKGWSHIGQVRASQEINCVECDVFFSSHYAQARKACFSAQVLSLWKVSEIN